jgi:hypothetical protein
MERATGIEPASSGWRPEAQPLRHARDLWYSRQDLNPRLLVRSQVSYPLNDGSTFRSGAGGESRTRIAGLEARRPTISRRQHAQYFLQSSPQYKRRERASNTISNPQPLHARRTVPPLGDLRAGPVSYCRAPTLATVAGVEPAGRGFGDRTSAITSRPNLWGERRESNPLQQIHSLPANRLRSPTVLSQQPADSPRLMRRLRQHRAVDLDDLPPPLLIL